MQFFEFYESVRQSAGGILDKSHFNIQALPEPSVGQTQTAPKYNMEDWKWETDWMHLALILFEAAREAILITNADGDIVAVNPAFTALSGYSEAELRGKNPRLLKSGRQSTTHYSVLWQTLRREDAWQGEFWNQRKDGGLYVALTTIRAVRDAEQRLTHYVGIATDITGQKEAEQRIEYLAGHDALTGLPNRTLLTERAELALALAARRCESLAVLSLDLDQFKEVNDALGHAGGDALLMQVTARIKALIRQSDILCRIGSDEFALLLPDTGREKALCVVDRLVAAFSQPFAVADHSLRMTTSIGIALYPQDGAQFAELLKNADAALYQAKQNGRNALAFYDRQMNMATFERLVLESELRKAIEAGQLRAYFQPKVRLADGALVGAEALVRWQHPEHGLIPPGRFISVAESSDLIVKIGDWMLGEASRQLAIWREAGLPSLTVAVNLAARHFHTPELTDGLRSLLAAHGLAPQLLELELTESTLLDVGAETMNTLQTIQQLGVGLSIDDFGTGYSSLSYLKRLPITTLKIDQSFVRDLANDSDNQIIVNTMITLGHNLGLTVIAEGVETEQQRQILHDQGCDLTQGYLFSPPLPAEDFIAWARQYAGNGVELASVN